MEIDKVFSNDVDGVADNLFSAVKNSVSEIKAMQQRKAAENVQLVIQALKKIESDLQDKFDGVTTVIEKRVSTIKDGRDGLDGRNGRDGKDGRPGRDGAPGARGPAGVPGTNGRDGEDGVSVTDARIDFDGSLIISLSSGREINVGEVVAPDLAEKIKVITNGGGTSQSVLDSLASLQAQITTLQNLGAVNYVGTWNASTNSPTITSGSGDKGDYYVVSVAGSTNIDGQTLWGVGDWIIFNGAVWQKVDGGSTGDFTNLSASGTVTFSGGTANGVAYLNGSKVLTSGSALTFDGSALTITSGSLNLGSGGANGFISGNTWYGINTGDWNFQAGNGSQQFAWKNSSGGDWMRLTSTGLGIGTSSPGFKLDVGGQDGTNIALRSTGTTAAKFRAYVNGSESGVIGFLNGGGQYFEVAGTERMRLDSSGNLGLGVTPSAWDSTYKAIQVGARSMFYGIGSEANMANNAYYNSGYKYVANSAAGLYTIDANVHKWYNAASGTAGNAISFSQSMTLDASGNLGVGTTSPQNRVQSRRDATTDAANSQFVSENRTGASGQYALYATRFDNGSGSGFTPVAFGAVQTAAAGRTGAFIIAVSDTDNVNLSTHERARITSGGYFKASNSGSYFGSTGAYHELRGNGTGRLFIFENYSASGAVGGRIHYSAQAPNNTGAEFLYCSDSVGERASIRSNGGFANYSANDVNLSDRREKTNFAPAKSYLETICAIPVQTFNYIDQSEDDPGLTLGVVAQDVQAVAPELVMESNWGTEDNPKMRLSIYQTDLQYALMKALQELKAEFDAYKATHP